MDLPTSERPRERLRWQGAAALADVELLALQLGSGTRGRNAIEVAGEMLARYGSLAEVAAREPAELARQLVECARLLDVRLHDHVVIGQGRYVSLAERGIV